MSAAQHTPGPWAYADAAWGATNTACTVYGAAQLSQPVADVLKTANAQANVRLIAAAPDLLAALVEAIEDSEEVLAARVASLGENYRPLTLKAMREDIAKGRAAIAKATGSTT